MTTRLYIYSIALVMYILVMLLVITLTVIQSGYNNTVIQSGYNNTLAAIRWVLGQIGNNTGQLSPIFSKLVILGSSAGSLAAQLWSSILSSMNPLL